MEASIEQKSLEQRALGFPDQARQLEIVDQESCNAANDFLHAVRELRKQISAYCDPLIKKTREAYDEAKNRKKQLDSPLDQAECIVKPKIATFHRKQEEERRRQEEEIRRKEEERRQQEEELRRKAEEAEKEGEKQWAETYKKQAEDVPKSTLKEDLKAVPKVEKLAGTYLRQDWTWELEDIEKIPLEFLQLDRAKITAHVKKYKDKSKIPGIRAFPVDRVGVRSV